MSRGSPNRAGIILGVPFFIGLVLISVVSLYDTLSQYQIPWDDITLAVGAAMLASSSGIFVSHLRQSAKKISGVDHSCSYDLLVGAPSCDE